MTPAPPTPKRRRRLLWLAAALGAGALFLVALELALRAQGYCTRAAIWFDAEVGYRNRPNQERGMYRSDGTLTSRMSTNEHGFRGAFPPPERRPGVARVVAIGDSYTFGLGVDDSDTYPVQLDVLLGDGVEVLNVSFPGWNVENALNAYRSIARDYRPDVVVFGFTMDDLRPTEHGARYTDAWPLGLVWWTAIGELASKKLLPKLPGFKRAADPQVAALRKRYYDSERELLMDPASETARPYVERAFSALEELQGAVEADGARLIVACFPSRLQVERLRTCIADGGDLETARELHAALPRLVAERCEALGLPEVDVLDAFLEAPEHPMGVLEPGHPSALGYGLIARAVAAELAAGDYLD